VEHETLEALSERQKRELDEILRVARNGRAVRTTIQPT